MRRKLARSAGLSIHTTTWRCSLERTKTKLNQRRRRKRIKRLTEAFGRLSG
jgi:hypothetical protein